MLLLTTPQGDGMRQTIDPRRRSLVVTATEELGNYRVRGGGESGWQTGLSVNIAAEASNLKRIDEEQLDLLLGEGRYRIARMQEQLEDRLTTGRGGAKLFPYLIALVALVLGLEHALSNRFYRERE